MLSESVIPLPRPVSPALRVGLALLLLFGSALPVAAVPSEGATETVEQALCRLIDDSAKTRDLPVAFLTRLIWRESSFRVGVVSPAGAQGVAQFMPGTAKERGLLDPFDPEQAIPHAAHLLADLKRQFGNLGLAAAAYNGGPTRVSNWLCGQRRASGRDPRLRAVHHRPLAEEWRTHRAARSSSPRAGPGAEGGRQTGRAGEAADLPASHRRPAAAQPWRPLRARRHGGTGRALGHPARGQFLEGAGAAELLAGAPAPMPG